MGINVLHESSGHSVLATTQSGKHSAKPDLLKLADLVSEYLEALDPQPEVSMNYQLRIGPKVGKNLSYDVKLCHILVHNNKGLAIRIKDDQGYWVGELICPTVEQASKLFAKVNPVTANFLELTAQTEEKRRSLLKSAPSDIEPLVRSDFGQIKREINSACKTFFKREAIGGFCATVMEEGSDRITIEAIGKGMAKYAMLVRAVKAVTIGLFDELVIRGYLVPVLSGGEYDHFLPTDLFLETRDDFLKRELIEARAQAERSLENKRRLLIANVRDRERAQKRVDDLELVISQINQEIAELEQELQS